jgi:hypothetical protein
MALNAGGARRLHPAPWHRGNTRAKIIPTWNVSRIKIRTLFAERSEGVGAMFRAFLRSTVKQRSGKPAALA